MKGLHEYNNIVVLQSAGGTNVPKEDVAVIESVALIVREIKQKKQVYNESIKPKKVHSINRLVQVR